MKASEAREIQKDYGSSVVERILSKVRDTALDGHSVCMYSSYYTAPELVANVMDRLTDLGYYVQATRLKDIWRDGDYEKETHSILWTVSW